MYVVGIDNFRRYNFMKVKSSAARNSIFDGCPKKKFYRLLPLYARLLVGKVKQFYNLLITWWKKEN